MTGIVQLRRRTFPAPQGTPGDNNEGELCLWFPTAAGGSEKPALYANDGTGWRLVNPASNPQVKGIASTAAGGNVETAFNAQGVVVAQGDIVIFTHPATAGTAYVYTGGVGTSSAAPGAGKIVAAGSDFTALGAALQVATGAEIITGTDTTKTVTPKGLRDGTASVPDVTPANDASKLPLLGAGGLLATDFLDKATGVEVVAGTLDVKVLTPKNLAGAAVNAPDALPANDANKYLRLSATGKLDSGFVDFPQALIFKANVDLTATYTVPTPAWTSGFFGYATTTGTVYDAGTAGTGTDWPLENLTPGDIINKGDMVIFDGAKYHVMATDKDLDAFVMKSGSTMSANALIAWPGAAGAEKGNVVLDLKGGTINGTIDGGTY